MEFISLYIKYLHEFCNTARSHKSPIGASDLSEYLNSTLNNFNNKTKRYPRVSYFCTARNSHTNVCECINGGKSICNKMKLSDQENVVLTCGTEDEARMKAAKIGRPVCGICVSSLYTTY